MIPIGVFDSGYGGLTVLKSFVSLLPQYDYIYLGDNARAPYGTRSFDTVYRYTLQSVEWLLKQNCPLIILACNTASAKALRSIQQKELSRLNPNARVLGVIRPTSEIIGKFTKTNKIGILATSGTVQSKSYLLEIQKFFPDMQIYQEACPMWVPLIENNEYNSAGATYFIEQNVKNILNKEKDIDALLLACTHYPLIEDKIENLVPGNVKIITQGDIVAESLKDYLKRHPEIENILSKGASRTFYTTDSNEEFDRQGGKFFGEMVHSQHLNL